MSYYTNKDCINDVLNYIEGHLNENNLNLSTLAKYTGYSAYHPHRLFTTIVNLSLHTYIQRRRLTEAAKLLSTTSQSILEIALESGYETQRSFTKSFKAIYKMTPKVMRKHHQYYPVQLKYDLSKRSNSFDETRFLDIRIVDEKEMNCIGFMDNTRKGFHVIGKCWHQLHKHKTKIIKRIDYGNLIGINDYSHFVVNENQPGFDYYATAQVSDFLSQPSKMITKTLPASQYIVFSLCGHNEESMENVVEYIYGEWMLQSSLQYNECCMYDFVKYGEECDKNGENHIEYWIPIKGAIYK